MLISDRWKQTTERWALLSYYQRFESLEFNHTLQYVVKKERSIIQTRIVLLIALLALARKFIILDIHETSPGHLLGLAAITLVLGVTYWLISERDDPLADVSDDTKRSPNGGA
jgi:uncharacterized membrane protein (DUF373 family)